MGPENDMANLIEHLLDLSFSSLIEAHPEFGFHPTCYRRYIDGKRIYAAKKRKANDKNEQQSQECELVEKRARRSRGPVRSNPVLPVKCIICDEPDKFVQDPISRKCIRDRLSKAETEDAGRSFVSLYKSAYDYFCSTNLNNLLVGFGFVIFTCAKLLNIFMHMFI
jgi:hypothetical protein